MTPAPSSPAIGFAKRRLQVSLVESRFDAGKVRKEHIASLGSVETPLTVAGRVGLWQQLNGRLARLDNRLDAAAQGKIRGDIHARVAMVTPDEWQKTA